MVGGHAETVLYVCNGRQDGAVLHYQVCCDNQSMIVSVEFVCKVLEGEMS